MKPSRVPRIIKIIFVADFIIVLPFVFFNILFDLPYSKKIESGFGFINFLFHLDQEANLTSWYSSMKLLLTALLLSVFVYFNIARHDKRSWLLLFAPIICMILSIDEITGIHEWLGFKLDLLIFSGERADTMFPKTGIWFVLAVPLLGVIFLMGACVKRYFKNIPHVSRRYMVGLLVLLISATAIESISNFILDGRGYALQVLFEELGEMLGETILLWATYELLASYQFSISTGLTNSTADK